MNRILVVEDHDEFRSIINVLLGALYPEAEVLNAVNGAEGLDLVQSDPPDLILLDIHMPVMDGFEMAMAVRSELQMRQVPIVVMTSARDAGPMLVRMSQFCQGVLTKPFSVDELSAVLAQLDESAGAEA